MLKNISMPVVALALGHLVTDLQAGALPIVLPHLKELFALSYSQLAFIVLTQNITSSVIQPLFGYITDKKSLPGMLPFCAAMAGAGFAFVGWVPAYALLMCTVVVIGVASATYHPQASKTTNFLSTDNNKAANMGLFSLGGNAGMAAGSLLMAFLLTLPGGLHNTMYFVLPGLLVFGLMMKYMPEYKRVNLEHNLMVQAAKKSGAVRRSAENTLCRVGVCADVHLSAFHYSYRPLHLSAAVFHQLPRRCAGICQHAGVVFYFGRRGRYLYRRGAER